MTKKISRRISFFGLWILAMILLIGVSVCAQDKHSQQNLHPGIPYSISDIENINLTNGNLMFNFNFGTVRGRGSSAMPFGLKYNSKLYETHVMTTLDISGNNSPQKFLQPAWESGWQYDGGFELRVISRNDGLDQPLQISDSCGRPNYNAVYLWKVMMYFPDGSQHEFRPTGYRDGPPPSNSGDGFFNVATNGNIMDLTYGCIGPTTNCPNTCTTQLVTSQDPNPKMTYYSTDGTFIRLEIPNGQDVRNPAKWTLFMPDGSKVQNGELDPQNNLLPQRVYDKNGNFVQRLGWGDNGWIDEFGRKVERVAVSPMEDHITRLGEAGEPIVWKVRWKWITVIKKYTTSTANEGIGRCCYSDQVLHAQHRVIDEIELPSQLGAQKYVFGYNGHEGQVAWNGSIQNPNSSPGWGDLVSVTLPSGAEVDYEFATTVPYVAFDVDDLMPLLGKVKEKRLSYNAVYDGLTQQITDTWVYSISQLGNASITGPDGGVTQQFFVRTDTDSDLSGRVYKEVNPNGTIVERLWANNKVAGCPAYGCGSMRRLNTYVKTEATTIPDNLGNPSLTAIKDFNYDKNGNVTKVTEYDWLSYASTHDGSGVFVGIPGGAVASRITESVFNNQTEDASNSTANNPNAYWNPSSPNVRAAIASTAVKDAAGTIKTRSEITYDNPATTANPTMTRIWDSTKGAVSNPLTSANSISTTAVYDQYGNPTLTTDARGVETSITYGPVGGYSGLYPTQVETASNYPTLKRTSTAAYDFHTGLVTTATDVDNNVSTLTEYDALGRPIKVKSAYNTPLESWVQTSYDDVNRRVVVRSDIDAIGDGRKVAIQHFDQLGRVRLSRTLENPLTEDPTNETQGIKVQTRYLTSNPYTYQLTSNPYRASTSTAETDSTMGWTRSKAWNTGRKQQVETFSGGALPAPWGSNTNSTGVVTSDIDADRTLITDQAGKQRMSRTNALGQLKDVWEVTASDANTEPITFGSLPLHGYKTSYSYDTLNNLTTATQGIQTRSFAYNSLSRLTSATNPESGTINYSYDPNGNLTQKDDARGVRTTYVYDALNRVTNRNYSTPNGTPGTGVLANYQATPNVTYFYDGTNIAGGIANSRGKLTKVASTVSTTEYTEFDILGRVKAHKQTTDGNAYTTGYTYNLSGALIEQTYPSGRVVKNTLDTNGDLQQVQSRRENDTFRNYANGFTYTAAGAVSAMRLGNGRWENTAFNSRLQPTQIGLGGSATNTSLLKLNYDYGSTQNNGNVLSQTITVNRSNQSPLVFTQSYVYDSLNRLKSAEEKDAANVTTWKQTYTFDRYGNRRFDQTNTTQPASFANPNVTNPSVDPSNNRFTTGQGWTYDLAGNVLTDAEGRSFNYDSENKQIEAKDSSSATLGTYYFDGDGKRVKKVVPNGETTVFVYDAGSKLVAEYSTIVQPVSNAKIQYLTNDNLGTPRINTDQLGNVVSRSDYMPYGEEIIALGGRTSADKYVVDDVRQGFTGYENDSETGLDYAQARMYSKNIGRFTGVDPLHSSAFVAVPQTWNRYVYVQNNPLINTDPLGLYTYGTATEEERKKFEKWHQEVKDSLKFYQKDAKKYDSQIKKLTKILDVLGEKNKVGKAGVDVKINFASLGDSGADNAQAHYETGVKNGKVVGGGYSIIFNSDRQLDSSTLAHEGQHIVDAKAFNDHAVVRNGLITADSQYDLSAYQREDRAHEAAQLVSFALRRDDTAHGNMPEYQNSWVGPDGALPEVQMRQARVDVLNRLHGYWSNFGRGASTYSSDFNDAWKASKKRRR